MNTALSVCVYCMENDKRCYFGSWSIARGNIVCNVCNASIYANRVIDLCYNQLI